MGTAIDLFATAIAGTIVWFGRGFVAVAGGVLAWRLFG